MTNPPPTIYLQWYGDGDPADAGEVHTPDVSWNVDPVFSADVEYVRADRVAEPEVAAQTPDEIQKMLEEMARASHEEEAYPIYADTALVAIDLLIGSILRFKGENAKLCAAFDRLPKTYDMVPVLPTDRPWGIWDGEIIQATHTTWLDGVFVAVFKRKNCIGISVTRRMPVDACYSTRMVAERAIGDRDE